MFYKFLFTTQVSRNGFMNQTRPNARRSCVITKNVEMFKHNKAKCETNKSQIQRYQSDCTVLLYNITIALPSS